MEKSDFDSSIFKKSKEFLEVFKKGEAFTQELLKENERLRYKIVQLEESGKMDVKIEDIKVGDDRSLGELKKLIGQLEEEKRHIADRCTEVEAENKDFALNYVEVEEENNNLANLYVASYQLHSTLDFPEVVRILQEIVINLVGAEKFAILVLEEDAPFMIPVASEGLDKKKLKKLKIGDGIIGGVAKSGESYFVEEGTGVFKPAHDLDPLVCIALKIKEEVIGVLVIFSLLEQKKEGLTRVDYELFSMLAGHAATALFSSKLYSVSERKLSTIQGFINLLSGKNH